MYEEVQVLTHSSIKISRSRTIYFDPYEVREESHDADVIFITHDHFDHYSPEDIKKLLKGDTLLVMPESMKGNTDGVEDLGKCRFINPDGMIEAKGLIIKAVPAYNRLKPFHTKEKKYVGYIVTMDDTVYYVAGDTDNIPDNQGIKCDVALIPAGGKYTMDYKEAAKFVNAIAPKLAIPTHYGTVAGRPEDGRKFSELVDKKIEVRVML